MLGAGNGLKEVTTADLTRAFRMVIRGELPCPLQVTDLARLGLQHVSEDLLGAMRHLDERATRAVLICVLAERRRP